MNFLPAKFGAQKKQIGILGGLLVLLIVVYLINRSPSVPDAPATAQRPATAAPASNPLGPRTPPQRTAARDVARRVEDFKPTVKLKEGTDLSRIDPTIRVDLLTKLRNAEIEAGARSIFDFSQPPVPKPPPVTIKPKPAVAEAPKPVVATANVEPPKPPPPPIPLKFYGYANTAKGGPKRAFFLDGEDIFVAAENEMVRSRYKIIRIGLNSAVVEDTSNKNQQTLPLEAELTG